MREWNADDEQRWRRVLDSKTATPSARALAQRAIRERIPAVTGPDLLAAVPAVSDPVLLAALKEESR